MGFLSFFLSLSFWG